MEIALDPTRKQHTIYSVKFKKCIIFPSELISNYCFCKITTKTYNTLSKKFQKDLDKSIVFLKFMINSSPYLRQYINIVEFWENLLDSPTCPLPNKGGYNERTFEVLFGAGRNGDAHRHVGMR